MNSMSESPLNSLCKRYPQFRDEIARLHEHDGDFRELCQDLAELNDCLSGAEAGTDPKIEEFLRLRKELESELLGMVEPSGGVSKR